MHSPTSTEEVQEPDRSITIRLPSPEEHDDSWLWRAVYEDFENYLDEVDENGKRHGFVDIDQSRLTQFLLLPTKDHLPAHMLSVSRNDENNTRLIFFRRRRIPFSLETMQQIRDSDERQTLHVLGWQKTVNGVNIQSFTFYFDDGSTLVSDRSNAL